MLCPGLVATNLGQNSVDLYPGGSDAKATTFDLPGMPPSEVAEVVMPSVR